MSDPGGVIHPHKKLIFQDEMGQKVDVSRSEVNDTGAVALAHQTLRDIGEHIKAESSDSVLKNLTYVGSAAVHIYQSEILGSIFYVTQTSTLGKAHELTCSQAITQLKHDCMTKYGRKAPTKRSGL